jgi:hypothetical protein
MEPASVGVVTDGDKIVVILVVAVVLDVVCGSVTKTEAVSIGIFTVGDAVVVVLVVTIDVV